MLLNMLISRRNVPLEKGVYLFKNIHVNNRFLKYNSGGQMSTKRQSSFQYCVDLVRKCDYENFLCTLLLPKTVTPAAIALRAFNVEIAQVQDMVSNKTIGQMRMQFWKDAVNNLFVNAPPHHPVAMELSKVLQNKRLSKMWFTRLINSREERLSNQPFVSITELENYSDSSVSPIYHLLLEYFGIKNVDVDHVASHVGKAQGVTNLIRGVPFDLKNGHVHLPIDVLMKHSLSQEDVLRGRKIEEMRSVIYDIACVAKQHVTLARSMKNKIPSEAFSLFLPLKCTDVYLERLQKENFDVFNSHLGRRPALLPLHLWWHKKWRMF